MNNTQKMNIETIALLCDTIPDGTGGKHIMDKILKNIHPYKVYYTPSRDSWQTSIYVDGIRQKVSRKSYKELVKYLVEFYKAQEKKTFADIYSAFMEEASLWKADNTILEYIKSYRRYYDNSDIIHIPLQDLDTVTLKTWIIKTVVAEKMTRKKYIKFISPLSGLLQYALEHDYITQNPLQTINTKQLPFVPAKPKRSSEKAFSREEATAISNVAKQEYQRKPSHTALAIAFLFETEIRLGECAALKWSDIEGNTLMVSRMERKCPIPNDDFTSYSNWRYEIIDTTKKNGEPRFVPLTDAALEILEMLRELYKKQNIDSEWLFVSKRYGKIHDRAMDIRIRKYCLEAGIPVKSVHKIRATFISTARDEGMSFAEINEIVGHKDERTTITSYSYDVESTEKNRKILNNLGFFAMNPS